MGQRLLILLLLAGAGFQGWKLLTPRLHPSPPLTQQGIAGFYQDANETFDQGRLGLRFFEDGSVDIFTGDKKLGEMAHYTIEGNGVKVQHACGVWSIEREEGGLFLPELKAHLGRQSG